MEQMTWDEFCEEFKDYVWEPFTEERTFIHPDCLNKSASERAVQPSRSNGPGVDSRVVGS